MEIREKVLELIKLELKNPETLNLEYLEYIGDPAREGSYFKQVLSNGSSEYKGKKYVEIGKYPYMGYTLEFSDGKPNIQVSTSVDFVEEDKELLDKRWFAENLYIERKRAEVRGKITFGDFSFFLSENEFNEIFNLTIDAHKKMIEFKNRRKSEKLLLKLDERMAKHKNRNKND
jgi:hypothetical protein